MYCRLYREIEKKGYRPANIETLAMVVMNSFIYRYRRSSCTVWQYEVVMPGYGKPPKMSKWIDVSVMLPVYVNK